MQPRQAATLLVLLCAVLWAVAPQPVRAETRAVQFPTAFRPSSLNNIATSATAAAAFVGSRDSDTLFAFDPRTGALVGQVEVGDGPLGVEMLETGTRRLIAVTCSGFFGSPVDVVAIVDATDPAHMRVDRTLTIPDGYTFFLGYRTARFLSDGAALVVTATDEQNGQALLLSYDVATGAELGRVGCGFVPGSIDIATVDGRVVAAISQSVAPRGRLTFVDVTDPAAMRVVRTVKLPRKTGLYNINNVVFSADASVVYVATGDGNALYTVDVETGAVRSRTVTGDFPTVTRRFTLDGQPRLLVLGENASTVYIYDVSTPSTPVLAAQYHSPAGFLDVEPSLTNDGRSVFVASTDGDRVFAVDTATGGLRYQAATGKRPTASAVWEGGGERYVCFAATVSADVTSFRDDSSGYVGKRFAGPDGAVQFSIYQNVALSRDGRYAFVASKLQNELLILDVAASEILARVPVAEAPSQVAVAENPATGRRRVVALGSVDATLTVVDATNPSAPEVVGSVSLETPYPFFLEYASIAVSGDGSTAFVADGNQFVDAIDLESPRIVGSIGTGFIPVSVALREDRGQRRLAVLNASSDSASVAVLDVSNPAAMTRVSSVDLPSNLVVALNNVPRFTSDGRFVLVGASLSEAMLSVDVATGRIVGNVKKTSAVIPAPYVDDGVQKFAAVNLGATPLRLYRLKRSGSPRAASTLEAPDGGFFLVGNDPFVAQDGSMGVVANYGLASLLAFDPRTGALTGQLPLGKGPGPIAVDSASGTVAAIEVNGTASRILFANLADLAAVPARAHISRPTGRSGNAGAVAPDAALVRDRARTATFSLGSRSLVEWTPRSSQR